VHGNTPYPLAMRMGMSEVTDFFESKSFANYRKLQESRSKMHSATLSRFDAVIKGMGGLGKLLAGLGKSRR
jgi:hypothetical protein